MEAGIGRPVGFEPWLYYGDNSHIVHLVPNFDLPENRTLLVTVSEDLKSMEGARLPEPYFFSFQTGSTVVDEPSGCRCSTPAHPRSKAAFLLFGVLLFVRRQTKA